MATTLRVTPDELCSVAANCATWAPKLQVGVVSPDTSLTGGAIAAAFGVIYADVAATGEACAARMQSTADRITTAATDYESTENDSSARIRTITGDLSASGIRS